jgi:glucokinase
MQETVLAVDLGGTKILVGEVTKDGEIIASKKYPSDTSNQRTATEKIKSAIADYLEEHPSTRQITGVGVCVVGRVDTEKGEWLEIYPGLSERLFLAQEIETAFGFPCSITNDVSSAAIAENQLGIGRKTDHFIYINIGTGIAARVVSQGKIISGGHFNAGEVGHMVVDITSQEECPCGRKGCVELFASGLGMHKQALNAHWRYPETILDIRKERRVGFDELMKAYEKKDGLARYVVDLALKSAAALTMNLVRVSDPEAIVFGGGVMSNSWFLEKMVTFLNPKTIRFVTKGVTITTLDPQTIALKGAALLAANQMNRRDSCG